MDDSSKDSPTSKPPLQLSHSKCCIICSAQYPVIGHTYPPKFNQECQNCIRLYEESSTKETQNYHFLKSVIQNKEEEGEESKEKKVQNLDSIIQQDKENKKGSWQSEKSETQALLLDMLKSYPVLSPEETKKFKDLCENYSKELLKGDLFKNGYRKLKYFKKPNEVKPLGVYKAIQESTQKIVAIKVCLSVPPVQFLEGQISTRREIENHESSIVSLDPKIWHLNGFFYLIMEYFSCDLNIFIQWLFIKDQYIEELFLAFIIKKVLHALCKLHKSGYYHGDVTAHNIFISYCFKVKLGDLGKCRKLTVYNRKQTSEGKLGYSTDKQQKSEEADIIQVGKTVLHYFFKLQNKLTYFKFFQLPHLTLLKKAKSGPVPSQECFDFIKLCLRNNPPDPWELLKHSFIAQTRNDPARQKWTQFKRNKMEVLSLIEKSKISEEY